ncbi:hypothetical protein HYU15_02760 [Candidatus Woesearchaeota archaeon]|nr:hypothetical protein [Candidatus Woesearchaeota archaeon]
MRAVPFSRVFDPLHREVYVVITDGREELTQIVSWLSGITGKNSGVQTSVVAARTEQEAARIYSAYGYLPVVLFFTDTTTARHDAGLWLLESALDTQAFTEITDPFKVLTTDSQFEYRPQGSLTREEFERTFAFHRSGMRDRRRAMQENSTLDSIVRDADGRYEYETKRFGLNTNMPSVLKIGGSAFDMLTYDGNRSAFDGMMEGVRDLFNAGYKFVMTVGGGPTGDLVASYSGRGLVSALSSDDAIKFQIKRLGEQLRRFGLQSRVLRESGQFLPTRSLLYSVMEQMDYIPIVESVPRGINNGGISPGRSDEVTIAAANYFRIPVVIFVKNTAGVYSRDPNITGDDLQMLPPALRVAPLEFYPRIFSDRVSEDICRLSPDTSARSRALSSGHLIDDGGLLSLRNGTAPYVAAVRVVDAKSPEAIMAAVKGLPGPGSYILK